MKLKTTTKSSENTAATYDNNPLLLAITGLERLFAYAKPFAITFLVVALFLGALNIFSTFIPAPTEQAIGEDTAVIPENSEAIGSALQLAALMPLLTMVLIVVIAVILFGTLVAGIADHSASATANGRKVTFSESLRAVLANFWPYLKLRLLMAVKIFLWSLLFILPGIYFAYRYALSGIVFFSEGKQGNAAIKRSLALTKNAWLTTFASYSLLNLLTLGMIQMVSDTATGSELYRNFRQTVDGSNEHPKSHIITKLFLTFILVLTVLILFAVILFGVGSALQSMPIDAQTFETV